jgi:type II secretory pathway pseudopilin PulG
MKIRALSRKLKKGFTLIELTVVMLTTSLLFAGFTAFTIFFTNQYNYEMSLENNENSAAGLKYVISNNIEKFNYTYQSAVDFNENTYKTFQEGEFKEENVLSLFTTYTPVEAFSNQGSNYYKGVIERKYKFVKQNGEEPSYFGYYEKAYTFVGHVTLAENEREVDLIKYVKADTTRSEKNYKLHETLSPMILKFVKGGDNLREGCKKITFTIDYKFATEAVEEGTKKLVFDKYVYFLN